MSEQAEKFKDVMRLKGVFIPDDEIPKDVFPVPAGCFGNERCAAKIFHSVTEKKPGDMLMRGTTVMETSQDPLGDIVLAPVTKERLVCKLESYGHRIARHETIKEKSGQERTVWRTTTFPVQSANLLLVSDAAREFIPPIRRLVPCPIAIIEAGEMAILKSGYHRHSGGTLITGGDVEKIPLEQARQAIIELLSDFAFQSPGDQSRAVASFITPALKFGDWISDDFPVDLSEANKSQTGKSYRFKMLAAIYGCRVASITNDQRGGVGSLDEKVSKAMIEGRQFISLQNIRGRVDSQILEEAIRGQGVVTARALRVCMDVDTRWFLWQMSTNGADLTRDFANRCIITRISKQVEGYKFKRYAEGDAVDHIKANRPRWLGAVFAILREWHRRGSPRTDEMRHDFRGWVQSLDYIVTEIMGLAPLLEGHKAEQERVGNPCLQWLREVARCVFEAGLEGVPLLTAQLIEPAEEEGISGPTAIREKSGEPTYARAGRAIKKAFQSDSDNDGVLEVGEFTITREKVLTFDEGQRRDIEKTHYVIRRR